MASTSLQALKRVRETLKILKDGRCFDYSCVDKMNVISANADGCVCEMTVEEHHLNRLGTMHGGCTATLVDTVSSMVPHVLSLSTDLSVTYLSAIKLGDELVIEAKNLKNGKSLAFLEVAIRRKSDGKLLATGKQTQLIAQVDAQPKP